MGTAVSSQQWGLACDGPEVAAEEAVAGIAGVQVVEVAAGGVRAGREPDRFGACRREVGDPGVGGAVLATDDLVDAPVNQPAAGRQPPLTLGC